MQHVTTENIIDYLHGALGAGEDARVYTHIESCDRCRDEYQMEVQLSEMLRNQAVQEVRELPPTLKAEIWQAVRELPPASSGIFGWLRPLYALPVAAAVLLAVLFAPALLHQPSAPSIEAAYYLQDHAAMNGTMPFGDHTGSTTSELR